MGKYVEVSEELWGELRYFFERFGGVDGGMRELLRRYPYSWRDLRRSAVECLRVGEECRYELEREGESGRIRGMVKRFSDVSGRRFRITRGASMEYKILIVRRIE